MTARETLESWDSAVSAFRADPAFHDRARLHGSAYTEASSRMIYAFQRAAGNVAFPLGPHSDYVTPYSVARGQ